MTIKEVKSNIRTSDTHYRAAYATLLESLPLDYIDEEVAVSETAEQLINNYQLIYTHSKEAKYRDYVLALTRAVVSYKTYEEVSALVKQLNDIKDIKDYLRKCSLGKGIKLSTLETALEIDGLK